MGIQINASTLWSILKNPKYRGTLLASIGSGGTLIAFLVSYLKLRNKKKDNEKNMSTLHKVKKKVRPKVDMVFVKRLQSIFKIVFPRLKSKETWYFAILTVLLIVRTFLSIQIASLVGSNAQLMVSKKYVEMFWQTAYFAVFSIPVSCVNSALKYVTGMLALRIRVSLSHHVHEQYIHHTAFYKATTLGFGKITHADQRVTTDILNFSESVPDLYCAIFKPTLDVVLFTALLGRTTGWQGPALMYVYLIMTMCIKGYLMPSFGKLIAKFSELEGKYRTAHHKLIANAEEIAFYKGATREKKIINTCLTDLENHSKYVNYLQALVKFADDIMLKYLVSLVGYMVLLCGQIFKPELAAKKTTDELTRQAIKSMRYLNTAKDAGLELVLSSNKITDLVGYTARVCELLEKLDDLKGEDKRFEESNDEEKISKTDFVDSSGFIKEWIEKCQNRPEIEKAPEAIDHEVIGGGKIVYGSILKFEDVDIVSPEGKILVQKLNFQVDPGHHVMVTGPNGCGKSSLFRVISELWPLHSGVLTKPEKSDIVFVPQKPYCVLGTLRDQLIYPMDEQRFHKLGHTDDDLKKLLQMVDPRMDVLKKFSFDDVKDWNLAFSGGQKQRIAMARMFFHKPRYGILDECTSSVSADTEDSIYEYCNQLGITIFTVSHRPQLQKFHHYELKFFGNGENWEWITYPHWDEKDEKE